MAHQFPFIDTDHSTSSTTIANLRADYDQFGVDSTLNLNVSGVTTFSNTVSIGATVFLTGTLTDGSTQVGAAGSILSSTGSGIRWIAANTTNVNSATNVGTNLNSTDANQWVTFIGASSSNNPIRVDNDLRYNPSTNILSVPSITMSSHLNIDGNIRSVAGNLELQAVSGENGLVIKDNNAVELYFDGSSTYKLATTDIGVDVRGELESDNLKITGISTFRDKVHLLDGDVLHFGGADGAGGDLQISHTNALSSQDDSNGDSILAGDNWASYINETGAGPLIFKSDGGPSTGAYQFYDTGWRPILKLFSGSSARAALYHGGSQKLITSSTGITVTGTVAATGFSGALTGNADTSTTATTATRVTVTDQSSDTSCNVLFTQAATGDLTPHSGTNLTFNSSSGALTSGSFVKSGGSSSQFLKADGSVDSNTYLTSGSGSSVIPSGSVMLFYQGSAPTGWTKVTTQNNKALRVVSGTGGGTGGTNNFTTVFSNQSLSVSGSGTASGTTGSTVSGSTSSDNSGSVSISGNCGGTQSIYTNTTQNALSIAQLAAHQHAYDVPRGTSGGSYGFLDTMNAGSSGTNNVASTGSGSVHHHAIVGFVINGSNFTFSGSGSPSNHDHDIGNHSHSFSDSVSVSSTGSLDMRVQYIDVIICSKD